MIDDHQREVKCQNLISNWQLEVTTDKQPNLKMFFVITFIKRKKNFNHFSMYG